MDADFTAYWGTVIYCEDGKPIIENKCGGRPADRIELKLLNGTIPHKGDLSGLLINGKDGFVEVLKNGRVIVSVGTEGLSDRDLRLLAKLFPPTTMYDDYSGAIYEDQP